LSRPFPSRFSASSVPHFRVNGKIRAREIRVIGVDGNQLGVMSLAEALTLARTSRVDLVEIAPNASPPVCRLVDYGKFRYEQAKRDKESKKHQHATRVKEVQLSPKIDPHDLAVKVEHSVGFLCEDMKVKVTLRFRGREMAHTEIGFQVMQQFLSEIGPYGHPDFQPKLIGRGINVMISPLPRNKRAKSPQSSDDGEKPAPQLVRPAASRENHRAAGLPVPVAREDNVPEQVADEPRQNGFVNNPFAQLEVK
jgi:translation initiation factor IF-3